MTYEEEQQRIWELRQEIRNLEEEREELEDELRSYDGYHGAEPRRIHEQISDQLDRARRLIRFYEGEGFLVTLRVCPEGWTADDPAEWNWQEMMDMEAVRLISCRRVVATPLAQLAEGIQEAK